MSENLFLLAQASPPPMHICLLMLFLACCLLLAVFLYLNATEPRQ